MEKSRKDKVLIMGFAPTSKDLAPLKDPSLDRWGINALYKYVPKDVKWDAWFELHHKDLLEQITEPHHKFLKSLNCPVYMHEAYPQYPTSVKFPMDEISDLLYGKNKEAKRIKDGKEIPEARYFSSSPALELGLAIYQGYKEIHIYGIDMLQDSEYNEQRSNMEYLIGFARGMGIKVVLPIESAMCKASFIYGYERKDEMTMYLRANMQHEVSNLVEEINKYDVEREQVIANKYLKQGMKTATEYWINRIKEVERGGNLEKVEITVK
jgi:hypothetical protein